MGLTFQKLERLLLFRGSHKTKGDLMISHQELVPPATKMRKQE